ncbi:MAG: helix-turn-helix domain-containing protein [Acutalibacteraceae bacterium]
MQMRLRLDKYLDEHRISRYELAKRTGIQYPIVDHYYKNTVQRYDRYILAKFCTALSCEIDDILELYE